MKPKAEEKPKSYPYQSRSMAKRIEAGKPEKLEEKLWELSKAYDKLAKSANEMAKVFDNCLNEFDSEFGGLEWFEEYKRALEKYRRCHKKS